MVYLFGKTQGKVPKHAVISHYHTTVFQDAFHEIPGNSSEMPEVELVSKRIMVLLRVSLASNALVSAPLLMTTLARLGSLSDLALGSRQLATLMRCDPPKPGQRETSSSCL